MMVGGVRFAVFRHEHCNPVLCQEDLQSAWYVAAVDQESLENVCYILLGAGMMCNFEL